MKRRKRVRLPLQAIAPTALAIGDVIEDLQVAERALFRVCADEQRRQDTRFAKHELDVIFAAWHAIKGCVGMLRARDPWREET